MRQWRTPGVWREKSALISTFILAIRPRTSVSRKRWFSKVSLVTSPSASAAAIENGIE